MIWPTQRMQHLRNWGSRGIRWKPTSSSWATDWRTWSGAQCGKSHPTRHCSPEASNWHATNMLSWAVKTRPYPGVPDLLTGLSRRALPMAVLSNKPDEFTQLCVTRLLRGWHFQAVQGATPELPRKPDPRGALAIAARMGVAPGEILYLGDTNTDMQTAVAAGMFPVGALWGFRTAEELLAAGAAALAKTPTEVLGWV